jgi:hypothetical protein
MASGRERQWATLYSIYMANGGEPLENLSHNTPARHSEYEPISSLYLSNHLCMFLNMQILPPPPPAIDRGSHKTVQSSLIICLLLSLYLCISAYVSFLVFQPEPVFVNVSDAQESIPKTRFRQPM